jgi:hypothetical protein
MRIGTRLLVAGLSAAAALTLAAGTASAATTTATAPAAALSHQAGAMASIRATPAASGHWLRNYAQFSSESECKTLASLYMYTSVGGGVVTNTDCVSNGLGGWELDLFISPLICPNVTGQAGAAEPAAKCA